MSTPVLEQPTLTELTQISLEAVLPYEDNDDPNHKTHAINPNGNRHIPHSHEMDAQEIVDYGRMMGIPIITLCGFKFIPKSNPDKYDMCGACMHIMQQLIAEGGA